MYPAANPKRKWFAKEPLLVDEHYFFMTAFIREAPIEENTASECIRTVAATMVVKLYEYVTDELRSEL